MAASALGANPAVAQGFEGVVSWQAGDKQTPMTQTYKGNLSRTEMNDGGRQMVMLADNNAGKLTMVMPDQEMFMVIDLKAMADKHEDKSPKITATGKIETIAGKSCEVYRYAEEASKPETMEMCAAKGMGFFIMGSGNPMGGGGPMSHLSAVAANPEYVKLYKDGFFPLRISELKGGQPKVMMLATKIEPKSVDATVFQVPSDYTEMKMPGGMPQRP